MFNPCAVIPCYNHSSRLGETLDALLSHGLYCIVVDDGSAADEKSAIAAICQARAVLLIRHVNNSGKGKAVATGCRHAIAKGFSHVLQIDADGQHDIQDISRFLALAQQQPEALITGIPVYDASVPKHRLYARYLTHIWVWVETLSRELKDSMCGFRVYPLIATQAILEHHALGARMDFDTEILVHLYWRGTPVIQQPTRVIYPENGRSHFRLWHDNWLITRMHTRLVCGMLWRAPRLLWRRYHQGRQQHWSRLSERGGYWGLKTLLALYNYGGNWLAKGLMYPVICYFFLTGKTARRASLQYLQRLDDYADNANVPHANWRNSLAHFFSFGRAVLTRLDAWRGKVTVNDLNFPNHQTLLDLIDQRQGAFILASHMGNIEVCRALAGTRRARLNVLVLTRHAENVNRIMREVNPDSQLNLIQVDQIGPETSIQLMQRLAEGEMIVMAADRTPAGSVGRVFKVPFLGRKAPFPQGPFILASLLRCPVYSMFCLDEGNGRFTVLFDKLADTLNGPRKERMQRLEQACASFAQRLEQACLAYPLQWFNFYDFWQLTSVDETVE